MRHLISDRVADLGVIHASDVELVSIRRPRSSTLLDTGRAILAARMDVDVCWTQSSTTVDPAIEVLSATVGPARASVLAEEIEAAVSALEDVLGCASVEVRMHTLRRPMCPLFHVDQVRCRLLITLIGPGTEWIANEQTVPGGSSGDAGSTLQAQTGTLNAGFWSLLKGGAWDTQFDGVLHRSPPGLYERLLLVLDPQPPLLRS